MRHINCVFKMHLDNFILYIRLDVCYAVDRNTKIRYAEKRICAINHCP